VIVLVSEIDCRGLACPQPVILTKKALEGIAAGEVVTVVDNEAARDNLIRMARNFAYDVDVETEGNDYKVRIMKNESLPTQLESVEDVVILVTKDVLGSGDSILGNILIKSFFYSLNENDTVSQTLIFLNSGVKLTCSGSEVLEHLLALEKRGCEILSCGTCLDYYNLKEKLCVGTITNMYQIVQLLTKTQKVISL
jgi:selenium metabolism protein YedF